MGNLSRIVWSEGMFLGPHHFQAQNRYHEDAIHFVTNLIRYEPYGFLGCELDAEALTNGTVAVVRARGVFPDGLPFHMPEYDVLPPPRPIADLFPPLREVVDVFLCVPAYQEGAANCALNQADVGPEVRFISENANLPDENTGRDAKPLQMGRKNIRLVLDTESMDGCTALRIAQIRRDPAGKFVFDERFIFPCLQISAAVRLMLSLRRLVSLLEEKGRAVAKPRDLANPTAAGYSAEGIANAWFLHCINSNIGPLSHLLESKKSHPEELFVALSRLAGALCTFGLESQAANLPNYDHDNLAGVFDMLDVHIRTHLELVVPSNRVLITLDKAARFFYFGEIVDQRTLNRSRWIFAIHCKIGESDLIESAPRLVKICSRQFIPKLVERALPAMKLTHLPVPPPALSPKVDYQYFSVDKAGPCWEHLIKTRQVGVYVPGELPDPEIELSVILES
jgi:type VI secretion system protein ImpJ